MEISENRQMPLLVSSDELYMKSFQITLPEVRRKTELPLANVEGKIRVKQVYPTPAHTSMNTCSTYSTIHSMSFLIITLHYTTLHYIALHCITLYITLRYITLQCSTPHQLHYITLHNITLHCTTIRYITQHYVELHYMTLQYMPLHCITL